MRRIDGVLENPAPAAMIDRAQDNALVMKVFGWVDQTRSDLGKTKSEAIRRIKLRLEESQIALASPSWNIRYLGRVAREEAEGSAPAAQDVEAITDTSADHALHRKVAQIRRDSGDEDLLDPPERASAAKTAAEPAG
ncbi:MULTISPECIES: hypothetical protein [unclassified Phenylobacterium]|uniref:hypothetical protein n=1 Tax=unclassified Phenylobacterium TaxID=2640670 RepID=UPI003F4F9922